MEHLAGGDGSPDGGVLDGPPGEHGVRDPAGASQLGRDAPATTTQRLDVRRGIEHLTIVQEVLPTVYGFFDGVAARGESR